MTLTTPPGDASRGQVPRSVSDVTPASNQHLTELQSVVLAVAAVAGAWVALPVPWPAAGAAALVALIGRRPRLLIVAVALLASGLSSAATSGLSVEPGPFRGTAQVVRDAQRTRFGVQVEVRARGHHLTLSPAAASESLVARVRAGDHLDVTGTIIPNTEAARYPRSLHIAGRLRATHIRRGRPPRWPWKVANAARDAVASLGRPLPETERALFNGFVLGDSSAQRPVDEADFQGSGLTHLLVVSGENVAFVLILAAPLLERSGFRLRWVLTVVLLVGFTLITRFEPSVLRAAVMAGIAATGVGMGRAVSTWRALALAVAVLVVADPFLVQSVGFGLSVGASAGIIAFARPVAAAIPLPSWFAAPLAVTVAAQIGVAPLLLVAFSGIPVATLPANVLAAPAAGLVMVVGLPCLVIASLPLPVVGFAAWIPRLLLTWIGSVARVMAGLPLGTLAVVEVIVAIVLLFGAVFAYRYGRDGLRRVCLVGALGACVVPAWNLARHPSSGDPVVGLSVVRSGRATAVVVTSDVAPRDLLAGLGSLGVTRIDLLVLPRGDQADRTMLSAIRHRARVGRILGPPNAKQVPLAEPVTEGQRLRHGPFVIDVVLDRPVLSVHVWADARGVVPN